MPSLHRIVPFVIAVVLTPPLLSCDSTTSPGPAPGVPGEPVVTREHPDPPHRVNDIWAYADTLAYMVGDLGMLRRFDGARWHDVDTGQTRHLQAAWGSGPEDVYAGGYDGLVHFDGTSWRDVTPRTAAIVFDIWGSSASDVYACGNGMYHFDGSEWTATDSFEPNALNAVFGTGPDDVYAGWAQGGLYHYDGAGWTPVDGAADWEVRSIWAGSPDDVWVGLGGYGVAHFDGTTWDDHHPAPGVVTDLTGSGGAVYAAGFGRLHRWTGSVWSLEFDFRALVPDMNLSAIEATAAGGVWAGGGVYDAGFVGLEKDGVLVTQPGTVTLKPLNGACVGRRGEGDYAVGYDGLLRRRDGHWRRIEVPGPSSPYRVCETRDGVYVLAGSDVVLYRDGAWTPVQGSESTLYRDITGTDHSVWAVSGDGVHRIGGASSQLVFPQRSLLVIAADEYGHALALGYDGELVAAHTQRGGWALERPALDILPQYAVPYGPDAFLVSGRLQERSRYGVWKVEGTTWADVTPPGTAVTALGGNGDVGWFAADQTGGLLRFAGGAWTPVDSPFRPGSIRGISRSPGPAVYAVGAGGAIARIVPAP